MSASRPRLQGAGWLPRLFAGAFGAFFGLCLLKFGNPPVMEKWVEAPTDIYEFVLGFPWPIRWAYRLLGTIAILGVLAAWRERSQPQGRREENAPFSSSSIFGRFLVALPLVWLVWESVAGAHTLDPQLTQYTLAHFAACVVCFYLGFWSLSRCGTLAPFWPGWLCGFGLVLAVGWHQHFGGLEETRRYFELYLRPQAKDIPPEFLEKMTSPRIFATLFYPNVLAGALLLFLPSSLGVIAGARAWLTASARILLGTLVFVAALGCLYWSGSKAGWLLMLLMGMVTLLRLPLGRGCKIALIAVVVVSGAGGFFWKYSGFFSKGAPSVIARFDYWRAAAQTTKARPVFGTGPGTFYIAYQKVKRPESEPSRLAHNDYLEQASDSGLPGFILYAAFIVGALVKPETRNLKSEGSPKPEVRS